MIAIDDKVSFELADGIRTTGTVTSVQGWIVWITRDDADSTLYVRTVEEVVKIDRAPKVSTSELDSLLGIHAALIAAKPYGADAVERIDPTAEHLHVRTAGASNEIEFGCETPMHALTNSVYTSISRTPPAAPASELDNLLGLGYAIAGAIGAQVRAAVVATPSPEPTPSPGAGTVRCLRCGHDGVLFVTCTRPGGCRPAAERVAAMEPDVVEDVGSASANEPSWWVGAAIDGTVGPFATRDLAVAAWREMMLERERGR